MRAGKINIMGVILVLALVVGGVFLHTFGPYYWDAVNMREVVQVTAITFQERGKKHAVERLTQELYHRDIPEYIQESHCKLTEHGKIFEVRCAWEVQQAWPFTSIYRTMSFEAEAKRGPSGFID